MRRLPILILCLGALLTACAVNAADTPPEITAPGAETGGFDVRRDATVSAVERVLPSVVNITAKTSPRAHTNPQQRMMEEFFGRRAPTERSSRGSGVVITEDGYVLTNVHVVGDADDIEVKVYDEEDEIPAERVAMSQAKDVALLRLKPSRPRKFKPAKFSKDDDLLLGETVIALGNPFGLGGSVSKGILSSKARRPAEALGDGEKLDIGDWIQTDAAINPGNSGGALINLRGELIGLNVAILSPTMGAQGIGFAIPIKRVNQALAEVLSGESVGPPDRRLWLGARLEPLMRPLTVNAIQEGSPAESAGLKPSDVILSVDGNPPGSIIDFNRALVAAGENRDVNLMVRRGGRTQPLTLRLVLEKSVFNNELIRRRLGFTLKEYRDGLLIGSVDPKSEASRIGLQPGMQLTALDGQPPDGIVGAAKLVSSRPAGEKLPLELVVYEQRGPFRVPYSYSVKVKLR